MSAAPGPSARPDRIADDLETLAWWPTEDTVMEAEWSRAALDVVRRVWRAEGASLYWRRGTEALRDDLQDWLLAEAMEFRNRYVPPDDPQPDELGAWCATLHHVLAQRARWHFSRVMRVGLSPEQTRQAVYSTESLDRPVGEVTRGQGGRSVPLGESLGEISGRGSRPRSHRDPLDLILLAEDLSERVAALEMRDPRERVPLLSYEEAVRRLDDLAPEPGAGQCSIWGCWRPARKGRTTAGGLCAIHYAPELAERDHGPRCEVEGCGRPAVARGLCTKDYQRQVKAERAVVAEAEAIAKQAADEWLRRCERAALQAAGDWAQHVRAMAMAGVR